VHYYDRLLEREELGRAPHLRRVSSFILTNSESTKQKLQVVQDALAALDYRFVAAKAINQSQILEAERDILRTLQECQRDELNYIITNINLALLMYKIKDKGAWDNLLLPQAGFAVESRVLYSGSPFGFAPFCLFCLRCASLCNV
jgi:hypothetical protein